MTNTTDGEQRASTFATVHQNDMPPPEKLYVSMGSNGIRMFSCDENRKHAAPVTVYVKETALAEVVKCLAAAFADPERLFKSEKSKNEAVAILGKYKG